MTHAKCIFREHWLPSNTRRWCSHVMFLMVFYVVLYLLWALLLRQARSISCWGHWLTVVLAFVTQAELSQVSPVKILNQCDSVFTQLNIAPSHISLLDVQGKAGNWLKIFVSIALAFISIEFKCWFHWFEIHQSIPQLHQL